MINKQKVKDWLNDSDKKKEEGMMFSTPAYLFTNQSKDNNFGNIVLFEHFGSVRANTYRVSSQITDHYMEDNVARQDHWAIAPDTYVLSGLIGEVLYTPPKKWKNAIEKPIKNFIEPLGMLSPTFDSYTKAAFNAVQAVEASFRRYEQIARNAYADFTGAKINPNQRKVASLLKLLQLERQLVNVWTPFGTFKDMAIQSISISQGDSKYQSNIEIELKQWRTISTETREATAEEKKAYLAKVQKMKEQDSGTAATQEKKVSTLKREGWQTLIKL